MTQAPDLHGAAAGRFIGRSVPRREDLRLVTGRGQYVDDIQLPGMLHVAYVRSPYARARVLSVDTAEARALDGVAAVYTAADLNGEVNFLASSFEFDAGLGPHRPLPLADAEVRYAGDPVAMVVARSRAVAEDAAELVEIDYEPLPPILDYETAADDAELVHPHLGSNVAGSIGPPEDPRLEPAFSDATTVIEETFHQHRHAAVPMETRGIVATWDPAPQEMRIWVACQGPHEYRLFASRMMGIPENRIRVTSRDVGGGFGQKIFAQREEACVMLAARKLGRPVKWSEDRWENLVGAGHARHERMKVAMAFDADGRIAAARVDHLDDIGAVPPSGGVASGALACAVFPGPYKVPVYGFAASAVFTNTGQKVAYRGPWMMETVARETFMDIAARRLGLDPVELRRRNIITEADLPYTSPTMMGYGRVSPAATLDQLVEMVDYDSFRAEQVAAREEGRLLGIGFSVYVEPSAMGFGALGVEVANMRVEPSGTVSVSMGTGSHGHSIETTMAQVVADLLGVDVEAVVINQGDTDVAPFGGGTGGSRTAVIGGGACRMAAEEMRTKIVEAAAHFLEAAPEDLEMIDSVVSVRGTPTRTIDLGTLAHKMYTAAATLPPGMTPGLEVNARYQAPPFTFSNAAHCCVVEIDRDTGLVDIKRYLVSEDCGVMINPMVVEGQIAGGVVQGIGGVLYEHMVYDDLGNPMTTTFLDYLLPTAAEVPRIEYGHVVTPSDTPGGYKGMGEGGAIGSPPAVINAVADALGVDIVEQPITPDRVLAWLAG